MPRITGILIVTVLLAGCAHWHEPADSPLLEIHFIDVGYGDAILLCRGASRCLIDGGYPPMTDTVLRYLEDLGVTELSAAVLTHPHPDHIGGLHGILSSGISTPMVYGPYPLDGPEIPSGFRDMIRQRGIEYTVVRDGDRIRLSGGIDLDVIHPETLEPDMNESSLVVYCAAFESGILFTADIGPRAQQRIETLHSGIFPVSILKAPHHGGESLESFYRVARPELTIVPDGINPYGNPRDETLAMARRWSRRAIRLSETGSVLITETHPGSRDFRVEMR
ncbi:MAG TPA: MBL fold metallo-hydrolase [bacterium]|nr:MBL fold metallo-hydrolase [bacterium]